MDGMAYESVGTMVGECTTGELVIGILLPTGIPDDFDNVFLTIPAAKALLIDLRDAVDVAEGRREPDPT